MKRSGFADLPPDGRHVPAWLKLGPAISEAIIYRHGVPELLSRLSDPFWFQAFGSVRGIDWHSSGITTSVIGALKLGLNPRANTESCPFSIRIRRQGSPSVPHTAQDLR
jgi:hypothetical protein